MGRQPITDQIRQYTEGSEKKAEKEQKTTLDRRRQKRRKDLDNGRMTLALSVASFLILAFQCGCLLVGWDAVKAFYI